MHRHPAFSLVRFAHQNIGHQSSLPFSFSRAAGSFCQPTTSIASSHRHSLSTSTSTTTTNPKVYIPTPEQLQRMNERRQQQQDEKQRKQQERQIGQVPQNTFNTSEMTKLISEQQKNQKKQTVKIAPDSPLHGARRRGLSLDNVEADVVPKIDVTIAALYLFTNIKDPSALQQKLHKLMLDLEVKGTILIGKEGLNGTISGPDPQLQAVLTWLREQEALSALNAKLSYHDQHPFRFTRCKVKDEIVVLGVDGISPIHERGTYVKPKEWNEVISRPGALVIDTRNDYEFEIGTFENAIDPKTRAFRDFVDYTEKEIVPNVEQLKKDKTPVAMFCTGGIRCEKATALLVRAGLDKKQVFHLEGGILQYLEDIPKEESLWKGECFVFDDRVTVDHDIKRGSYTTCFGCGGAVPMGKGRESCTRCETPFTTKADKLQSGHRTRVVNGLSDDAWSNATPSCSEHSARVGMWAETVYASARPARTETSPSSGK